MDLRDMSGGGEIDDVMDTNDESPNKVLDLSDTVDSFFDRLAQERRIVWIREQLKTLRDQARCFRCARVNFTDREYKNSPADPSHIQLHHVVAHLSSLPNDED